MSDDDKKALNDYDSDDKAQIFVSKLKQYLNEYPSISYSHLIHEAIDLPNLRITQTRIMIRVFKHVNMYTEEVLYNPIYGDKYTRVQTAVFTKAQEFLENIKQGLFSGVNDELVSELKQLAYKAVYHYKLRHPAVM